MTQRSRFWDGLAVGDAVQAPYDAAAEFSEVLLSLSQSIRYTQNRGGVFRNELNELLLSLPVPGTTPARIASGHAFVYGAWYENDANVDMTIPTPGAATRVDRIVLEKNWAGETVRLVRIVGTEGAGPPAMTQTPGVTWDIPIARASITTAGVVTLIDDREFLPVGLWSYNEIMKADNTQRLAQWYGSDEFFVTGVTGLSSPQLFCQQAGAGVSVGTSVVTTTGRPGWRIVSNTDGGQLNQINLAGVNLAIRNVENYWFKTLIRQVTAVAAGTTDYLAGLRDNLTAGTQDGIYFRSTNSGNWFLVCRSAGVETAVDMLVAPTTVFIELEFRISGDGAAVQGFVNNVATGAPIITNIPTAGMCMMIGTDTRVTSGGAAAGTIESLGFGYVGDAAA